MDIHVDPLGGWSGDMFAAAMLDAFPEFWPQVQAAVATLDLGETASIALVPHRDHALTGRRFMVAAERGAHAASHQHAHAEAHAHSHAHAHASAHAQSSGQGPGQASVHASTHAGGGHHHHRETAGHGHRAWADIRAMLVASSLASDVKDHAIAIFALLAEAEAEVHGVPQADVAFHEVGAVDSIVDIVAAAQLIASIAAENWTSAPLPLGAGRVQTQHGILPVPAPATALLLRGLPTIDDGIAGERVTPTGAAIARYLLKDEPRGLRPRHLRRTGTGFGTRTLPGISNCLRVLAFSPQADPSAPEAFGYRQLAIINFEIDDMSAEDLSAGLDHLRAVPGVHDATQAVAYGKKGRIVTSVQILVAPEALNAAIAACFSETSTLGLRYHRVEGAVLERDFATVQVDGHALRVKRATRPGGGRTAKTEAADVAATPGHAQRAGLREAAQGRALDKGDRG